VIKKIVIQNYRIFQRFNLDFQPGMNIIVGDNDCGKSTLLEAVSLALTGRLRGRLLAQELSPYLFNAQATKSYLNALRSGSTPAPPEIIIDLFFDDNLAPAALKGTNNLLAENAPGARIRVSLNPDFSEEYKDFIKKSDNIKLIPTEYYKVDWLGFSGNGITFRSIPATASLIDASSIRLQSGADYYLQGIINSNLEISERVELSRAYRSLRETFSNNPAIAGINAKLSGTPGDVTDRSLSLSIDISQRSAWESSLVPHLDDLPFDYVGKGEQSCLKILLALNRKVADAHILLVEEPENHVSFSTMNILVAKIAGKCKDKQVMVTTHSSYVLNKLGLDSLILVSPQRGLHIRDLPSTTVDYFQKLSGYDTLRIILARSAILVEGPSDELIVQRAYLDRHGKLPIQDGVDVINVRGLSAARFLDIAVPLNLKVTVVTDNDGKEPAEVKTKFAEYTSNENITVHVGKDKVYRSLEPQICAVNSRQLLNSILGTSHSTVEDLMKYMSNSANKTSCALAIFGSDTPITMPEYINDAIA
jgi:ABC-type multidrug transport system ATPase subunit